MEAMLWRIFARETKHMLFALAEYMDALAVVVIRRRPCLWSPGRAGSGTQGRQGQARPRDATWTRRP